MVVGRRMGPGRSDYVDRRTVASYEGLDSGGTTADYKEIAMGDREFDIGKIMDEIFAAAEDFTHAFTDTMGGGRHWKHGFRWNWQGGKDFYPAYSYPPTNVYMKDDKTMVLEFALAGFREEDITLEFKGDYLVFSATAPPDASPNEEVKYFKRRLKFKDISGQKYYAPADKFDRDKVKAVFTRGILRVTVPPHEEVPEQESVKVNIEKDADESLSKEKK